MICFNRGIVVCFKGQLSSSDGGDEMRTRVTLFVCVLLTFLIILSEAGLDAPLPGQQ